MAATRLIALHVNKGKTVEQCLADRTDYAKNELKLKTASWSLHMNVMLRLLMKNLLYQKESMSR